jgi:ribosomal protein S10
VQLRTPSPEAVARIIRLATEANDDGFAEPHWDCRVHTRVLEMALEHDTFMDRVDFLNWYVG